MFKKIKNYLAASLKNPLLSGSLVMVVGTNLYNVGQFFYHSVALRTLGEAYYGDLAAIISIFGIIATFQLSVSLTIIRYIARLPDKKLLRNLATWINWWGLVVGALLGLGFLILSPLISQFLYLHQPRVIYLLPIIIFFFTIGTTARAVLQGLMRFNAYIIGILLEMTSKIILTVVLAYLSFGIWGATIALLVGTIVGYAATRFCIRDLLLKKRGDTPDVNTLLKFSLPVLIQGLALTSMYSVDLLLVKHFFSGYEAGVYASLAVLGRIAFFVSTPIASVMFPNIARRHAATEPYYKIFFASVLMTATLSLSIVATFRLFPNFVFMLFSGHILLESTTLLWWFSLFMTLLSLGALCVQFYLSIGETWVVWLFASGSVLQALMICFFHSSLLQVIQVSIFCAALLVISLFIYFPYHDHK